MGRTFFASLWLVALVLPGCGDDSDSAGTETGSGECAAACRHLETVCYEPAEVQMDHQVCESDCTDNFDSAKRACIIAGATCETIEGCFDPGGTCTPQCGSKECGDDGCGHTCGTCPSGKTCSDAGKCVGGAACISEDETDCYDGTCCPGLICRERTSIAGRFSCCIFAGDSCDRPDVAAGTIACCGQYDGWAACANDGNGGLVCKAF